MLKRNSKILHHRGLFHKQIHLFHLFLETTLVETLRLWCGKWKAEIKPAAFTLCGAHLLAPPPFPPVGCLMSPRRWQVVHTGHGFSAAPCAAGMWKRWFPQSESESWVSPSALHPVAPSANRWSRWAEHPYFTEVHAAVSPGSLFWKLSSGVLWQKEVQVKYKL